MAGKRPEQMSHLPPNIIHKTLKNNRIDVSFPV
jgi:hypothetical protein